ncbi:hypothetical protein [Streptomyces sp. NPDC088270]|uniref:hypothetical protein n=1 Tax=Streptomyces sp. NPDC088270 TaxID=3160990 RepID=UPI003416CEF6
MQQFFDHLRGRAARGIRGDQQCRRRPGTGPDRATKVFARSSQPDRPDQLEVSAESGEPVAVGVTQAYGWFLTGEEGVLPVALRAAVGREGVEYPIDVQQEKRSLPWNRAGGTVG